ncbi:MAG: DUF1611 domain-containing protein [Proteobacteria bacterium]|nr:DUF1611 domain-containing protein [Pseudomonadota bacterium]
MEIRQPYLLFLGDAPDDLAAKTARGVWQWRPQACVGQFRLEGCATSLQLPDLTLAEARERGAKTLLIGVANRGGVIPDSWRVPLVQALELGMDIASGLHTRLSGIEVIRSAAERTGCSLHEVRHPEGPFPVATGAPRPGRRLLTVGTDCSVGKMYTALALERELRGRGIAADFRATGQTGILIAGSGVAIDAVVADFISGATEELCPANDAEHWDLVEGQGSLFHASFAGVSLGLLHGAQPEALVLCHEPTRTHMRGLPHQSLPGLKECMDANLAAASLVSPEVRFVGVAINTSGLDPKSAETILAETEAELALPCVDPLRQGVDRIVDGMI